MSGALGEPCNELGFMYESDASSSFLVVRCEERIIEYQVRMLENNDIGYIVPVEVVKKEGVNHFFYNITSRIPLSLYMRRHKLSVQEFLRLLLGISASISDSSGYLLTPSNFVLNAEYVYIDPETMDATIIYIPAAIRGNAAGTLQSFVSELLMQHIHEEGFGSGNIVQRILSEINSEMFNIKSFIALLNGLLYGRDEEIVHQAFKPEQNYCNKKLEDYDRKDKIEEKHTDKEKAAGKTTISPVIFAVFLQFLMGGIIYICRGLLYSAGKNPAVTFAAVILIVLSVEVLVFRKLQAMKLFDIRSIGNSEDGTTSKRSVKQSEGIMDSSEDEGQNENSMNSQYEAGSESIGNTIDMPRTKAAAIQASLPQNNILMHQKTEQLGKIPKGACMLKHADRLNGGQDIIIDRDEFIIGRLTGHVDHVLHNNAVGKLHAEIIRRNGSCYVKDLNSINGTYINNQRIESNKEIELKDNDRLLFANSEFIFVAGRV